MANGQVGTGFSKPYVAEYSYAPLTGAVTYSDGAILARGVDVSIEPSTGNDNNFYADNVTAETESGTFTGGRLNLTVDGLFIASERLISGLPAAENVTVGTATVPVTSYGNDAAPPDMGFGFIWRRQSAGVVTYTPVMLTKVKFAPVSTSASTQGESIDWQTQSLSATIMRDDTANGRWKRVGDPQTTELAAENVIRVLLGLSVITTGGGDEEDEGDGVG